METIELEDGREILVTNQDIEDIAFDVLNGSLSEWADVEDIDGVLYVTNIENGKTYQVTPEKIADGIRKYLDSEICEEIVDGDSLDCNLMSDEIVSCIIQFAIFSDVMFV